MKKKHLFLAVLAIILILTACLGTTLAYFTSYASGNGGYIIHLSHRTKIFEFVGDLKQVQIQNIAEKPEDVDQHPVFIRAIVYYGSDSVVTYEPSTNWSEGGASPDDERSMLFYYQQPIYAAEAENPAPPEDGDNYTTSRLKLKVTPANPDELEDGDAIDVLVTYQAVPAVFTPTGAPDLTTAWANAENIVVINQ